MAAHKNEHEVTAQKPVAEPKKAKSGRPSDAMNVQASQEETEENEFEEEM